MDERVRLYFWNAEEAEEYPPTEEILSKFPAFYAERYRSAKIEPVRQGAVGSAWLLADHLGVTSEEQLSRGEHGAVALRDGSHFLSLSHCGPVTVLAVSDVPVGVDLETADTVPEATVRRFFPPSFQKRMADAAPEERLPVFLECWTQLEAAVKADGRGLTAPRGSFEELLSRYELRTEWVDGRCLSIAVKKEHT